MKKHILLFLLFTGFLQAQTYPVNPTKFGKISLNTNGVSTSTTKINTQEADGQINYIDAVNLPVPTSVTNAIESKAENSAGAIQGFAVTNNGNGTVNIASGTAYLRATNDQYAPLIKYTIPAVTNLALTDNANNYVLVDYNGGVPALTVTTNGATINTQTNSLAILISRVGTTLDYLSLVSQNNDANAKLRVRFLNQEGIRRANGAIIGFASRNLTLTSGTLFSGLIRINSPAFNTASPDTFTYVYNNGSVWTRVTGQTQVNNTQYNNAGTLTTMPSNDFRVDYIYLLPNNPSKLYVVYGSTTYNNITLARNAPTPTALPSELQVLGLLVGRQIIQKDAVSISEVSSAFAEVFTGVGVPEHNALAGLQGGGANDRQHLTTTQLNGLIQKNTIAEIRAFTGTLSNTNFYTTDLNQEGNWYYDASDTTSADNTGTILVTSDGKRIKRAYAGAANVLWFGVKNNNTNTQIAMDAMLATNVSSFRFPSGIYQSYMNNTKSDRTFIFDEGAIIDGVAHIAVGSGPDIGGGSIVWVRNTRVIGTLISTVRVGMYYCDGVNIDKTRITEVNPIYVNQTAEGGSRGVHIYAASKNVKVGEMIFDSATFSGYALGIDLATTTDSDHLPENVSIGRVIVKSATQTPISISNTKNVSIDEAYLKYSGTTHGVSATNNTGLKFGKVFVDGTGSTGTGSGFYNNNSNTYVSEIISHHCAAHGVYVNGGNLQIQKIESYNNALDGVRILTKCFIENIKSYSNTQRGVQIFSTANNTQISSIESYSNTMDNVFVDAASDVEINSILAYSGTTWGLFLNNTTRFKNQYLRSYSNNQALRYIGNTDAYFGQMYLSGSTTNDIALSGTLSGFTVISADYTTISGGTLENIPRYKSLNRGFIGAFSQGDVSVTLTVGTSNTTQRFGTILTANRTVTLSTTGAKNGDKFKVVRTSTATGAFGLDVGGLKTLSVSQWCDVEFNGTIWVLTAYGNLDESATTTFVTASLSGKENTITATTSADYYRGDKTFQPLNYAVIGSVLTGYISGAGTIASTDTVLQAIQKLNGNDALKADLASPIFTGNPTAPTPTAGDSDTSVATTDFVTNAVSAASATSGTYTPTASATVNVATVLLGSVWSKVGTIVTVRMKINVSAFTTASIVSKFTVSLPINKTTSDVIYIGNGAMKNSTSVYPVLIEAAPNTSQATVTMWPTTIEGSNGDVIFMYNTAE